MNLNQRPARPSLLLALLLALSFISSDVSAVRTVEISDRMKFYPPRLDQRYEKLQVFLKAADGITYSIASLKPADRTMPCSVVISQDDIKGGFEISSTGDTLSIMIAEDSAAIERKPELQSAIISSLLLGRFGMKPGGYAKLPGWMVAAILYKIERRRSSLFLQGVVTYPGVRALCISGSDPDLWNIVNCPLKPGDGPSYRLYAETCSLLMEAIMKFPGNGKEMFITLLKSALNDEKQDDALRDVLSENIKRGGMDFLFSPENETPVDKAGAWFRMAARNGSVSIFYPGTSDFAVNRLEAIETLGYTVNDTEDKLPSRKKDGKDLIRTCRIGEIGRKWPEIRNPDKLVIRCQKNFSDLSNQLPSLFQDEMNSFIVALKKLKDGEREGFEDAYARLRKNFEKEVASLRELENFIDEGEKSFIPFATRHASELRYLEETGSFTGTFWSALDAEMDKL
ncbi:MAG TPA: hypothetical protein DET40_18600 [Lentisphaeria bacterium]|nr:MAG: hypothetical protein A2X45_10910 [Lentisphaerae bacterium GWF2_50_93]HCE45555.1 hypothetical protein [Lentisphaeria bacterium]